MKHGRSAFVHGYCRCEVCTEAQRAYLKAYRSSAFGKRKHAINAEKKRKRDAACREWIKQNQPDIYEQIRTKVENER